MNYQLRDYQRTQVDETLRHIANGTRSICVQLPTRGGKSGEISYLCESFKAQQRVVWFLCHTNILLDQMSEELDFHGIKHGIIAAKQPMRRYAVQVISKDTLTRRSDRLSELGWRDPDVIIIDEAHRVMGATYLNIVNKYPRAVVIGFTATPKRLDGKPMGDIFEKLVMGPSIEELQRREVLAPVESFIPESLDFSQIGRRGSDYDPAAVNVQLEKQKIIGNAVHHYEQFARGRKALTFCASIEHAKIVAEEFSDAGYPSVDISSADGRDGVKNKLSDYYSGKYINMTSCNLFVEGLTVRECGAIIDLAPTMSLTRYLQKIGRGMMRAEGKDRLIHLDCVGNVLNHGFPTWPRAWSLDQSSGDIPAEEMPRRCPECFHPVPRNVRQCEWCGYVFDVRQRIVNRVPDQEDGKLISINDLPRLQQRAETNRLVAAICRQADTYDQAITVALDMGRTEEDARFVWVRHLKREAS